MHSLARPRIRRPALRWLTPVVTAGAVAGAVALPAAFSAGGAVHPALPARTAAQVLAAVAAARVPGLSGTVRAEIDLGLPSLPTGDSGLGGGAVGTLTGLLGGTHTVQVWTRGTADERLAVLGSLQETDVVRAGRDLWTYDSASDTATHTVLPAARTGTAAGMPAAGGAPLLTPQALAEQALAAIDPATSVTVDRTARIAGRDAYTLVLTPRGGGTLIGSVRIAIDATTGLPLRTTVVPVGSSTPAVQIGFTALSYSVPGADRFRYSAPPGATLTTSPALPGLPAAAGHPASGTSPAVSRIGSGWQAVLRLRSTPLSVAEQQQLAAIASRVPQGELISTRLLTVLVTPGGDVYAGAVPAAGLLAAAAGAGN